MTLQNRVTPFGALVATPERGTLFGNRGGRFHDPDSRTLGTRRWASKRWICCRLDFKGRKRTVWGNGYTELFFHDEATALTAGHRPCFECRRHDAVAFGDAVQRAFGLDARPGADWLDARLHQERLTPVEERASIDPERRLPAGTVIASGGKPFVMHDGVAWPWIGFGWKDQPIGLELLRDIRLVTPPAMLGALDAGYRPLISIV